MCRDIISIVFEILFSIFIIIMSYYIWDGFDQTDYMTAKYYDNIKDVQLLYESNADNGIVGNDIVLSVHNISEENNNKDVIFKLNKDTDVKELKINGVLYILEKNHITSDELYNYYLIENVKLLGYETKYYFINIDDNAIIYDYEFITEL